MSYVTLDEFKAWVSEGSLFDSSTDDQIQMVLDAVDRAVDRYCARHFTLETAVSKFYYPSSPSELEVTDLISIESLASDNHGDRTYSTEFSSGEYELLPYIDSAGYQSTRFDLIRLWPTVSKSFSTAHLVKIVGDFGFVDALGQAPADVKQACLILAARWWKRRETPFGILGATDLGQFERLSKSDYDVVALLSPYSRGVGGWVAV